VVAQRYEVEGPLGSGGMGIVYRVRDRLLDEVLALKVLGPGIPDAGLAERLRLEMKLARRVSHENVCRIHDYGEDAQLHYISMELVEGLDLKRGLLAHGPPPAEQALDVALQVVAGLEAIHRAGILHRDLKSANIMLGRNGLVKLMDFGIAKAVGSPPAALTHQGQIVGSPEYMSPEQARGETLDFRSDVYSLGVVLFELFTGRVPFQGDSPLATVLKHLNEPAPLDGPEGDRLPQALRPVLRAALAKAPPDRYASASDLARALRAVRTTPAPAEATPTITCVVPTPVRGATPASAPPPGPASAARGPAAARWAAAGIVTVALAAGWLALRHSLTPNEPREGAAPPTTLAVTSPSRSPAALPTPATRSHVRYSPLPRPTVAPEARTPTLLPTPPDLEPDPSLEVPIGTPLAVRITTELRSDRTRAGSPFEARLDEPLVSRGRQVAAEGAALTGRVLGAGLSGEAAGRPFLELALGTIEVGGRPVAIRTGLYRLVAPSAPPGGGPSIVAIVIGAAAGGLVGAAAGGRSGALAGAEAGAAAVLGASPHAPPAEYRVGNRLTFKLAEPLVLENDP
jgi:eukaryotic-like serine/threonine-protein kinase